MPSATALEFQTIARKLGFSQTRQSGSHQRWNHPDGRAVTIPLHGGREIGHPSFSKSSASSEFRLKSSNESADGSTSSQGWLQFHVGFLAKIVT
jgi:predicted RNA binding protein YcfA (HicA-like mRNA interferase family)